MTLHDGLYFMRVGAFILILQPIWKAGEKIILIEWQDKFIFAIQGYSAQSNQASAKARHRSEFYFAGIPFSENELSGSLFYFASDKYAQSVAVRHQVFACVRAPSKSK